MRRRDGLQLDSADVAGRTKRSRIADLIQAGARSVVAGVHGRARQLGAVREREAAVVCQPAQQRVGVGEVACGVERAARVAGQVVPLRRECPGTLLGAAGNDGIGQADGACGTDTKVIIKPRAGIAGRVEVERDIFQVGSAVIVV